MRVNAKGIKSPGADSERPGPHAGAYRDRQSFADYAGFYSQFHVASLGR